MKLNNNHVVNRKPGMTLLELTVVILVLLSLISILFVGARAWKKGSDRSACIINIRNVQQAVRGHINMNPALTTAPDSTIIFTAGTGTDGYLKPPICPSDEDRTNATSYAFAVSGVNPPAGEVFLECLILPTGNGAHVPDNADDW